MVRVRVRVRVGVRVRPTLTPTLTLTLTRPVGFDAKRQLPASYELCTSALDGAIAMLTWEKAGRILPYACTLHAEPDGRAVKAR